jgi:hypothetical protein
MAQLFGQPEDGNKGPYPNAEGHLCFLLGAAYKRCGHNMLADVD